MGIENHKLAETRWDWEFFCKERDSVLDQWPTGERLRGESGLKDVLEYHQKQPWYKYASLRNLRALEEDRIQIVPQVGHALIEMTTDHMIQSEDLAPDRWYVLTDTYTRKGQFAKATAAVNKSLADGFSYLNGYPIVTHGVEGARQLNECTRAAVGTDNNDEDARLAWEIVLAGGWSWGTVKSIEQVIQHSRDYPLDRMIFNHQYMDRLTAYFNENGVPILRRASANLPGWDTLGFKVTVSLLECILAAKQGTKFIDLSLGIGMNIVQDVAAIQVLRELAIEMLAELGLEDVKVFSWTYFFLGDWPRERGQMVGQLAWNAGISALAGCNGMIIKSPDEATTTPTGAGFREAVMLCGQIARLVSGQRFPDSEELSLERNMITLEVKAVLGRVRELGEGDLAIGACRAIEAGVLDTMFSPWRPLRGEVKIARDRRGALRYLDSGQVPLPKEVLEHHKARLADRERYESRSSGISWMIEEATWASRPLLEEVAGRRYWDDGTNQ